MAKYTRKDIKRMIEEEDVAFIRLQFTDILGTLKDMAVTTSQLDKVLDNQCMFDGANIEGFTEIDQSDLYLHPDLDTFAIFPWRPQHGKVARLICDLYHADGIPFEGDPRYVLKKVIKEAEEMGLVLQVGPECEFFLFDTNENGSPTTNTSERGTYFDNGPNDSGENAKRDMIFALEDMGFEVEGCYHENAPAQQEIDFKYNNALATADNIMTFQLVVRTIARRHGMHATFMPKPKQGIFGSGMHVNMSLTRDGVNIFDDETDKLGLSQEAYHFIAGVLAHIEGMTVITNPLVNSYKRLTSGYEAPIDITWSSVNRSALIRTPKERDDGTRVELRSPDPAANPYLTFAVCLAAGLDGMKKKLMPPEPMNSNLLSMTNEEKEILGLQQLPNNLSSAVKAMHRDKFVTDILGEHITKKYTEAKTEEWKNYSEQVSAWEIEQYLYRI